MQAPLGLKCVAVGRFQPGRKAAGRLAPPTVEPDTFGAQDMGERGLDGREAAAEVTTELLRSQFLRCRQKQPISPSIEVVEFSQFFNHRRLRKAQPQLSTYSTGGKMPAR